MAGISTLKFPRDGSRGIAQLAERHDQIARKSRVISMKTTPRLPQHQQRPEQVLTRQHLQHLFLEADPDPSGKFAVIVEEGSVRS